MYLAAGCLLLGVFPVNVIAMIDPVITMAIGGATARMEMGNWVLLAPINADRASYSPLIVLVVIVAVVLLTTQIVHRFYHGRVRRAPPWDCGYPLQTARMQDTAEGFGQPIREVFDVVFRIDRQLPTPFDTAPKYAVRVEDHFWYWLYLPLARVTDFVARQVGRIQQGRISVYLVYSFITLLALLFFVR